MELRIPKELATAINRRRNGREDITQDEIIEGRVKMELFWRAYKKAVKKLDYIYDEWWDKMKIEESQFSNPQRFYYGHRKLRNQQKKVKDIHRQIFGLLVYTDGNYESFSSESLGAEECYLQFMDKYKIK